MHHYHKVHANFTSGFNLKLRKGNCIGSPFSFSCSDSCAQMGLESRANHVKVIEKKNMKDEDFFFAENIMNKVNF